MALLAKRVSASIAAADDGLDFGHAQRARRIHHLVEDFRRVEAISRHTRSRS